MITENLESSHLSDPSPLSSVEFFGEGMVEELNIESEEEFPPLGQTNRINNTTLYPEIHITRNPTSRDLQSTPLVDDFTPILQFSRVRDDSPGHMCSPIALQTVNR